MSHHTVTRRRFLHGASALATGLLAAPACGRRTFDDSVRGVLERLIATDRLPGALAVLTWPDGIVREFVSGQGLPQDASLRIASNTKTFTATVVLQLVAEGRVALDAPVERYLPGLVSGNGNDGSAMTVRHLLQHTSGLHDYGAELTEHDPAPHAAAELVAAALRHPPDFPPGSRWAYSNTGYQLAGMIVERVTGGAVEDAVTSRIIEPLGLRRTYWPLFPEQHLRGPQPKAFRPSPGGRTEVRWINTSVVGCAGALVSTGAELNAFAGALLGGRLLPDAQLDEMTRTVPAEIVAGGAYGLGLVRHPLPGGGWFWGHGGSIEGTRTRGGVTSDGRAVTVAVNEIAATPDGSQHVVDAATAIFSDIRWETS
ncbi:serine hydrolase domain-containing protein [Actinomycetes bacterium KLBMP 9759]